MSETINNDEEHTILDTSINYKLIKSKRGKYMLIYNNHIYNIISKEGEIKRFRCKERSCYARTSIENDAITLENEHNHVEFAVESRKRVALYDIGKASIETNDNIDRIMTNVIDKLDNNIKQDMPKFYQ